ncbi:putative sugar-phosphate isomerase, RpiB/LacA/LacB family, rmlC-like cupin domain superfamily [Helianthus anomalus]
MSTSPFDLRMAFTPPTPITTNNLLHLASFRGDGDVCCRRRWPDSAEEFDEKSTHRQYMDFLLVSGGDGVTGVGSGSGAAIEGYDGGVAVVYGSGLVGFDGEPWPENIQSFLDKSLTKMPKIGTTNPNFSNSCVICDLASGREFTPVEIMPGGSMKIVRESPTAAVVRFSGGSVEPAHHHSYGHDRVVMKGRKIVWNLSKNERCELGVGDYLFTPGGVVHRVKVFGGY